MADQVFNIAKGAFVEKIRDSASNVLLLLLVANETDGTLVDHEDVSAMLGAAGNTEATFTNYARKTGLTATITVDHTNNRTDVDVPDQTFTGAGGASNQGVTKAVLCYEDSASEAGRVPLTHHECVVTTDGNDITLQVNAAGFARAS